MTKRKKQKELTHARLLQISLELFAKNGITATKTIDVAHAAQVSHGTIFVHFPTRDDLVTEVINEFTKRVVHKIHDLAELGSSLKEVLQAHIDGLADNESFYARLVMEGPVLPSIARTTLIGIQSAISYHLAQAAEIEIKKGTIRNVPIHLLFNTWIGLIHHYVSNKDLFAPGGSVLKRRGQELLDHFLMLLHQNNQKEESL